ncbi:MAG: prephenate dehydrogenase [Eubacterium sp.]|jgi:prephenate dehydrogenase
MTVGVVGLGLIGGSLARAYKRSGCTVYGADTDKITMDFSVLAGAVDKELTDENIPECDVIFLAITPEKTVEWLKDHAAPAVGSDGDADGENGNNDGSMGESAGNGKDSNMGGGKTSLKTVIDCCGVKRRVCAEGFKLADEYGFTFVGGHPMAGKQTGGFKNSRPDLFDGALFAIVPSNMNDIFLLSRVKRILQKAGFTRFMVMKPDEHDLVIAYTSQMAHLISNAYIKSDVAKKTEYAAVSGGAFRDMTRVAYLDEDMWTELFMDNRDYLKSELDGFIGELERYRAALEDGDAAKLSALLAEGKLRKKEIEDAFRGAR